MESAPTPAALGFEAGWGCRIVGYDTGDGWVRLAIAYARPKYMDGVLIMPLMTAEVAGATPGMLSAGSPGLASADAPGVETPGPFATVPPEMPTAAAPGVQSSPEPAQLAPLNQGDPQPRTMQGSASAPVLDIWKTAAQQDFNDAPRSPRTRVPSPRTRLPSPRTRPASQRPPRQPRGGGGGNFGTWQERRQFFFEATKQACSSVRRRVGL